MREAILPHEGAPDEGESKRRKQHGLVAGKPHRATLRSIEEQRFLSPVILSVSGG